MKKIVKKSKKYFEDSVRKFLIDQAVLKTVKTNFDEVKEQFYKDMDEYFKTQELGGNNSVVFEYSALGDSALKVTKVQKISVDFEVDKLEKVLSKEIAKKVIAKKYEVANIEGLISYLKKCNVDPKVFKGFLNITKYVDTDALDKLEELGMVTMKQIEGCYSVKKPRPYYTVSEIK